INDLSLPKTCKIEFPDPDDLLNFKLVIAPDEGFYRNGHFDFSFKVGQGYPHDAPKVKCETKVFFISSAYSILYTYICIEICLEFQGKCGFTRVLNGSLSTTKE
ncbi:NEDD8-conjugating enzyme Ubc12, partial [Paramuricea clavata]